MKNVFVVLCSIVVFVVGCGYPYELECDEFGGNIHCEEYDNYAPKEAFDDDYKVVPKDEVRFDYEMYKTWNRTTKTVFSYREMTWEETDGEAHPKCYEKLPDVRFIEDAQCGREGYGGCYYWSNEDEQYKITSEKDTSCGEYVRILYHEFTHHFLVCNYDEWAHLKEYYESDEYWGAIDKLRQEICY